MTWLLWAALAVAAPLPPLVAAYVPDELTPVTATPGRVTEIVLEPGERLAPVNPVAAGDTARWIIGQTESGAGGARRVHVLVKPVEAGIATNLLILTDRRAYRLDLRSSASRWSPTVSWRYPAGALVGLAAPVAAPPPAAPVPRGGSSAELPPLNFAWRVKGAAPFRPVRVYDDGRRTYIELPDTRTERPLLFVVGPDGRREATPLRSLGARLVADTPFALGELRLGKARVTLRRGAAR